MISVKKSIISVILLTVFAIPGKAQNEVKADSLYENYKNKRALRAFNKILANDAHNVNALWHVSLLNARIGEHVKRDARKKKYFKKAKRRAQDAINISGSNSNANFAMAVAIGQMARVGDMNAKLDAASDIKKYATRAIQSDSSNAGAWFTLGMWNYKIATMSSLKELGASLFTHIPKGASVDAAVNDIRHAIRLHPTFVLYYYHLARIYKSQDKKKYAIKICRKGRKQPSTTPDETKYKRKCQQLIRKLQ